MKKSLETTPPNSTEHIVLDLASKKHILDQMAELLETEQDNLLIKPLIAASNLLKFPTTLKLDSLQAAYQEHKDDPDVAPLMVKAIRGYLSKEGRGFELFRESLTKPDEWNQATLLFFSTQLKIKINEEPFVEASIKNGKIHWRIVHKKKIVHTQPGHRIDENNKFQLTWKEFRDFKDSGKRSGTAAITEQRFVDYIANKFPDADERRKEAKRVWKELKQKRILNDRDRLSQAWRSLSNKVISLELQKLAYSDVIEALNSIVNDKNYQETIGTFNYFRPERSLKSWASTGLIKNFKPKEANQSCTLWDVGTFHDLTSHAVNGDELQHDHIPSTSILTNAVNEQLAKYRQELTHYEEELQKLENEKNEIMKKQPNVNTGIKTRANEPIPPQLKESFELCQETMKRINQEYQNVSAETKDQWWTIEIPDELHQQGKTFLKSASQQKINLADDPPFLGEVGKYFTMLRDRFGEFFKPNTNRKQTHLQAIGAFRHLYKRQTTEQRPDVAGHRTLGTISQRFFQKKEKEKIDQLFFNEIREFEKNR